MFLFCPGPLPTSSNNIFKLNIDNSKKSTKLSTKHCNSEKFCVLRNVLENILFFSTNLSQGNFSIPRGFSYHLKFLILSVLLLEWNKTCCIDFFCQDFVKLLNISLDGYSLFFSHVKYVFFIGDREWIFVLLSRMMINNSVWPQISNCTSSDLKE